ncbi:hypothetical protein [Streptomyces sp. NPDC057280]|uniref:helix-turn-helix domain-containing protein n=1 Tax=Streptomyces sp. NPDC057280 TaxID=3346081 RepID=UPI00362E9CAB
MTPETTGHAWAAKSISGDIPPGKRDLAIQIQRLCAHLTGKSHTKQGARKGIIKPTQAQAAERLKISETSLSRFLSGRSVPSMRLLEQIYGAAQTDARGNLAHDVSLDDLRRYRERAEADHCDSCVALRAELDALKNEKGEAAATRLPEEAAAARKRHQELEDLVGEVEHLKAEQDQLQKQLGKAEAETDQLRAENAHLRLATASRAGSRFRPAPMAATRRDPLPVPRRTLDRQRITESERAALNIAHQAQSLQAGGRQGSTISLLHHTVRTLSHAEIASLVCLLRRQQEQDLADNLIHIYGRDQSHENVVRAALELHESGAPDDAGALLLARATL